MERQNRNILISGAGIAGLTLAFWLNKFGFNSTIVENASRLREGGYMIDFWGVGFDVAEKMGIIEDLREKHYHIRELAFVDENGKRVGGFNIDRVRKIIDYRHFNMLRGELAKVLYDCVKDKAEFIFGNSIAAIEERETSVRVSFADYSERDFDLVIGADGLHSNVRKLVFGAESKFEKFLGYTVASFTIENYLNEQRIFQTYSVPGKSVSIYSIAENKLATLFVYKSGKTDFPHYDTQAQKEILRENFKDVGWQCPAILEKMTAEDFYFDVVSQIKMGEWSKGKIALVGDACACVSLVAGKGSSLAMAEAYTLAGELKNSNGNYANAFADYEKIVKPEVESVQRMAKDFAPSFVPDSEWGIWKRNLFTKFMFLPLISKWLIKRFFSDTIELKEY